MVIILHLIAIFLFYYGWYRIDWQRQRLVAKHSYHEMPKRGYGEGTLDIAGGCLFWLGSFATFSLVVILLER